MTRKWRNLAAQIMIVTILLPFVAILTGLFFSDIQSVNDFIDKMINFIPMFDTISNVIFNFSVNMAAEQYTQLTMYILVSDFFEAIVLGVTIDVCKRISKLTALEHLAILKVFLIFSHNLLIHSLTAHAIIQVSIKRQETRYDRTCYRNNRNCNRSSDFFRRLCLHLPRAKRPRKEPLYASGGRTVRKGAQNHACADYRNERACI